MSEDIRTDESDSLRGFFLRVNSDADFRISFLEDPVNVLASVGISLSRRAEEEVSSITKMLVERLPNIADIPTGFASLFENIDDIDAEIPDHVLGEPHGI